ncbi:MAG: hypothetical protein P1Q69_17120 [Candidatus Thorarchaeota archaeon]|nr:hypothetical protein [Candidatus Thorarchaeota archaeon]
MNKIDNTTQTDVLKIKPWQLALVFLLLALLAPFQFLIISEDHLELISPTWIYFPIWNSIYIYEMYAIINRLPFTFLRFLFALQIGRYYKKDITRTKVIAYGILGEVPSFFITLLYLLQPILSAYPLVIGIPIPVIFAIAIYLMRSKSQPQQPLTWKGKKKVLDWWPEIDAPQKT